MFKCKVCTEKDKLIQELSTQVSLMRTIVYPSNTTNHQAFLQSLEASKILDGTSSQVIFSNKLDDEDDAKVNFDNWS